MQEDHPWPTPYPYTKSRLILSGKDIGLILTYTIPGKDPGPLIINWLGGNTIDSDSLDLYHLGITGVID